MLTACDRFFVLNFSNAVQPLPSKFILSAGNHWANKAKQLIFADIGEISIENLMVGVLQTVTQISRSLLVHSRHVFYSMTMIFALEATQVLSCLVGLVRVWLKRCKSTLSTLLMFSARSLLEQYQLVLRKLDAG
jgi:hypothetical protein